MKCKDYWLTTGVCYRSPSSSTHADEALYNLIRRGCKENKQVVIGGDFNHRTIDWKLLHSQREDRTFLELTLDCFLTQHVHEPRRGTNILDLVFFSEQNMVQDVQVREPLGSSDHNAGSFSIVCDMEIVQ